MTTTKFEKNDIKNWLFKYFAIERAQGNEINFPCPYCGHTAFYFNVAKSLGFCHHDICHRKVNLDDLIDIVGSEPEEFSGYVPALKEKERIIVEVKIPETSKNLIDSNDLWAMECLSHRNVTPPQIKKFNIYASRTMLYVPVYDDGELVQYVGRAIDRSLPPEQGFTKTGKRYLYAKGASITNYFLGWDECKLWEELLLVENTFNSIWLRDQFHCTTNFGSFLSKEQIKKLTSSRIQSVVFLWDEGAHVRSEAAVRALKKAGIRCVSVKITGQPDDYTIETLKPIIEHARQVIKENPEVNFI